MPSTAARSRKSRGRNIPASKVPTNNTTHGKKILIAEDERPMARALELKLSRSGFLPKVVFDGEEAIRLLDKESFDLVLLDLVMPKVDGFAVLTHLKSGGAKTPVIIISNLSQEEDAKRSKELGAADYLVKSEVAIQEIVERVKRILKL